MLRTAHDEHGMPLALSGGEAELAVAALGEEPFRAAFHVALLPAGMRGKP